MTSTATDAIVALVVIGAAIATLLTVGGPADAPADPDPTLETLTTGTTTVNYTLTPDPDASAVRFGSEDPRFDRRASGAFAELLAAGALTAISIDETPVSDADKGFQDAVSAAAESVLAPDTQVAVVWRPYPDAHLDARLTVGDTPPPDADVSTAATTVPSGMAAVEDDNQAEGDTELHTAARADGYEGLSRLLADRIVTGLFPPERTRLALRSGGPPAGLTAHRYDQFGDAYGVDLREPVGAYRPMVANERLAAGMADRIETDLREQFDSPTAAARAVEADRVHVVVRRWG